MLAPVQQPTMNRAQRRYAKKAVRHKPAHKDKSSINPVLCAVIDADFKQRFKALKLDAEQQCIASQDVTRIVYSAGFLLFVTLRALVLDRLEIEDLEVIEALAVMGAALGDLRDAEAVTPAQRQALITGMDYLDALVQAVTKEAMAVAWFQIDQACQGEGVGTQDLDRLLVKLKAGDE